MQYFPLFYGLFTIVGGVIGFLKAGSTTSLIAGSVSGLLLILSAVAYLRGKNMGRLALLVLSLVLGAWFLNGFLGAYAMGEIKIMPAGLMVALSLVNFVICLRPIQRAIHTQKGHS